MDKSIIDEEAVSLPNGIMNKLPPWLMEMTESVRKLNQRDDYSSLPVGTFGSDCKLAGNTYSSCSEISNKQEGNDNTGATFKLEKFNDIDDDIILKKYAKDASSCSDDRVNVSNRFDYDIPETTKIELNVRGRGLENMDKRDRYVGRSAVEYYPQSRIKWDDNNSKGRGMKNRRMKSSDWRPFRMIDSRDILTDESRIERERRERRASFWETKYDRNNELSIEPIRNTSSGKTSEHGDLPIGIVRRKLDYLAGVVSREKIPGIDDKLKTNKSKELRLNDDFGNLVLEGSQIRPIEKSRLREKRDEKSANSSSKHRKNLYHYERYPTKDSGHSKEFIVPELPRGKQLILDIVSTWGDKHFVGLNGIEIFSATGEPVTVTEIRAAPQGVNELNEYAHDQRTVENLINGTNRTRDDLNMWLTPFTEENHHYVHMTFREPVNVALIRIWVKYRFHVYD